MDDDRIIKKCFVSMFFLFIAFTYFFSPSLRADFIPRRLAEQQGVGGVGDVCTYRVGYAVHTYPISF